MTVICLPSINKVIYHLLTCLFIYHVLDESAMPEGESEKVPVENSEQPSVAAGSSVQPQQALSLVCDE